MLILAAVDFSQVTDAVAATARTLADALGAELRLLNVIEPLPATPGIGMMGSEVFPELTEDLYDDHVHRLEDLARRMPKGTAPVQTEVARGFVNEELLGVADSHRADFIVLGSHGHGPLYHLLLGSTAEYLIRRSACPVVVVPHPRAERHRA